MGDNIAIEEADDTEWDEIGTDEEGEDERLSMWGVLYSAVVENVKGLD